LDAHHGALFLLLLIVFDQGAARLGQKQSTKQKQCSMMHIQTVGPSNFSSHRGRK
jgi:hypothetical protein